MRVPAFDVYGRKYLIDGGRREEREFYLMTSQREQQNISNLNGLQMKTMFFQAHDFKAYLCLPITGSQNGVHPGKLFGNVRSHH